MSIFITMSLSLSAQHSTQTAQFFAIDFSEANSTYAEYWQILSQSQRHNFNLGRQRKFAEIIQMVYTELEQRLEQVDELGALKDKPTVYLMIYGIQRARDLDQDAYRDYGSFGQEEKTTPSPAKQFAQILKEGSDLGIYTVLWCDTVSNMNRRLERQMIKEFDLRILFQMSKEDASPLLDAPAAAAKLGAHRALLYDMQEGTLEKFRPFALPNNEWLFTHLSVS